MELISLTPQINSFQRANLMYSTLVLLFGALIGVLFILTIVKVRNNIWTIFELLHIITKSFVVQAVLSSRPPARARLFSCYRRKESETGRRMHTNMVPEPFRTSCNERDRGPRRDEM